MSTTPELTEQDIQGGKFIDADGKEQLVVTLDQLFGMMPKPNQNTPKVPRPEPIKGTGKKNLGIRKR